MNCIDCSNCSNCNCLPGKCFCVECNSNFYRVPDATKTIAEKNNTIEMEQQEYTNRSVYPGMYNLNTFNHVLKPCMNEGSSHFKTSGVPAELIDAKSALLTGKKIDIPETEYPTNIKECPSFFKTNNTRIKGSRLSSSGTGNITALFGDLSRENNSVSSRYLNRIKNITNK